MSTVDFSSMLNELVLVKEEIVKLRSNLEKQIETAPSGTLRITKKRKGFQYYQKVDVNDTKGKYIPRKDQALAVSLAQKDYDSKLIEVLKKQQKAIERFLKDYDPSAPQQVYDKLTEARKMLVKPEFLSDEEFVRQWLNTPYTRPSFRDTTTEFYTAKGERVRSKSEILIADALFRHNIPYRCEYPVYDKGVIFAAPDFNCLNVRLRKEYYWEHLGMLGKEDYSDKNVRKIEKYTLAECFDETCLILTMETEKKPLNTKVIEEKIRRYLL